MKSKFAFRYGYKYGFSEKEYKLEYIYTISLGKSNIFKKSLSLANLLLLYYLNSRFFFNIYFVTFG